MVCLMDGVGTFCTPNDIVVNEGGGVVCLTV